MKIALQFIAIYLASAVLAAPKHEVRKAEHAGDTPEGRSAPKVVVALPNYDEETATKLQIFLDNNDFGPG